jgi:hypothetical protein
VRGFETKKIPPVIDTEEATVPIETTTVN